MDDEVVRFDIVPASPEHVSEIVRTMRAEDRLEVTALGLDVSELLHGLYGRSHYRRAALLAGDVAAVWGTEGDAPDWVHAWLFTSPVVERAPLAFFRQAQSVVREALEQKRELQSQVMAGYTKSERFWQMMGFDIGEPIALGPQAAPYRWLIRGR